MSTPLDQSKFITIETDQSQTSLISLSVIEDRRHIPICGKIRSDPLPSSMLGVTDDDTHILLSEKDMNSRYASADSPSEKQDDRGGIHDPSSISMIVNETGTTENGPSSRHHHVDTRSVLWNASPSPDDDEASEFVDNIVITSKYTWLSFIPKFLFESFSKLANFFFLIVCILQSIPQISNTFGIPTNAPVLFFVIAIDAIFAIMEDIRRHRSDAESNGAICHVVRTTGSSSSSSR